MKVVITGKDGQLGWELTRVFADLCSGFSQIGSDTELLTYDASELDITDAEKVTQVLVTEKPKVVINAAAYTAVDKAESDTEMAYQVNADGAEHLANACAEIGAKLIHVSTDFVFNAQKNTPYEPTDSPDPLGVYGASKLEGEQRVSRILGEHACIVRTAWVYSVHGNNFVKTMLRLMAEKEQLGVVSDQVGTPTSAHGLAKAIWLLADSMLNPEQVLDPVYHWSDLGTTSWYDFAVSIQELGLEHGLLEKAIPVNPIKASQYPTPAKRPAYSVLDTSAIRNALDIDGLHWRKALNFMIKELSK